MFENTILSVKNSSERFKIIEKSEIFLISEFFCEPFEQFRDSITTESGSQ